MVTGIVLILYLQKLQLRVRELEQHRRSNSHQPPTPIPPTFALSGGGVGGEPCSPSVSFTSLASVSEEGDTEHITAKYTEMKVVHRELVFTMFV